MIFFVTVYFELYNIFCVVLRTVPIITYSKRILITELYRKLFETPGVYVTLQANL